MQETTKGGSDIEKLRFETEGRKIRFGDAHIKSLRVGYACVDNAQLLIDPGAFEGTL